MCTINLFWKTFYLGESYISPSPMGPPTANPELIEVDGLDSDMEISSRLLRLRNGALQVGLDSRLKDIQEKREVIL